MTADIWPWLAVAGVGALHGLNPATGWAFVAAAGVHSGDRSLAWRSLLPLVAGHSASIVLVAGAVALGFAGESRAVLQVLATGLLLLVLALHLFGRLRGCHATARMRGLGTGLWSFIMATAHGAGLMLVPALVPVCIGNAPAAREISASGSMALALMAVALHGAAMLLTIAVMASGVCRGFELIGAHAKALAAWRASLCRRITRRC